MSEEIDDDVREYVVKELGRHRGEKDVIFAVARHEGLDWRRAEALVEEVKSSEHTRIARRQSPLLVILGVGTLLGGLGLVGFSFSYVFGMGVDKAIALLVVNPGVVAYFVTGLGMIAGSIIGLGRVLSDVVER
jgi:hypothetical protein